jgi:hypothetical protein
MRIENLRTEQKQNRARVAATIIWEDSERPEQELYFETDRGFEKDLACNPQAFLIAAIMPAFCGGEKRVAIEARVDPEIRGGILVAMTWIRHWWYDPDMPLVRIEDRGDAVPANRNDVRKTAMFFSGGVDSLALLRTNRINFPAGHPLSITDALLVFGLEVEQPQIFELVLRSINTVAQAAGLLLIPVYTNVRQLNPDWMFWERVFQDAVFASIAHAFAPRFSTVCLAATYDIPNIQPAGAHPLLDLSYSCRGLRILYEGLTLSRLDKLRLISDWDVAFQHIRTCNKSDLYRPEMLNCGKCRKCITTMLALMALGRLGATRAFPESGISPEFLRSNFDIYRTTSMWWQEIVQPLREQGHEELARIIEKKLDAHQRLQQKNDLKKAIIAIAKRIDRKYLNGRMREFSHSTGKKRGRVAAIS